MTNSTYKFAGGEERKAFGPLPDGDYSFSVSECQPPYQKDSGNWVLSVRLSIQPGGETVFANPWSGTDKNHEDRDGIGEFLLAVNRAPAKGQEPNWRKVVGARGRCRLKIELAQQGTLAGKEVNKVAFFHRPKELGGSSAEPPGARPFTKEELASAQQAAAQAAQKAGPAELEPDDIPF